MELKQYIFPIYSGGTIVGQAFVADGYLITAAHVVKDYPSCYTVLKGEKRELSKEKPFNSVEGDIYHDENMIDVVLYPCKDIDSPLHLSNYISQEGDQLESYCVHEASTPFSLTQMVPLIPTFEQSIEPAIVVKEKIGNYFYCDCKRLGGSSGSPLLKDNDVVGIMHGGNDNGLCAFLKVNKLLEIIHNDEVCLAYCTEDSNACEGEDALWQPYAKIVKKNGKLGVVIDDGIAKKQIIPFVYDAWFNYDGYETEITEDFFDYYYNYIGYFAIKNTDGTFTIHGFNKDGNIIESFTCDKFNPDIIKLKGKAFLRHPADGIEYDDIERMGYYYGQLGNDNSYFALCKGNKWSLKSADLKETYLDYIECDGFHEMGWTPMGYYVILRKANKFQLYIGRHKSNPLFLPQEYDYIEMRYYIPKGEFHVKALCFVVRKGNKYAICSNDLQYLSPFIFDKVGNMIDNNHVIGIKVIMGQEVKLHYGLIVNSDWVIKDFRIFDDEERAMIDRAEVVASLHGNSVCFFMKGGGQSYIPLSEQSKLAVGDELDLKTAKLITLSRKGNNDIYRVIE